MSTPASRASFLRSATFALTSDATADVLDGDFVRALLAFGSETPCNHGCVEHVGVADVVDVMGRSRTAFALRERGISLAEVLNVAEGSALPAEVAHEYPEVTQEEWAAVQRLTTLLFVALERERG